MRMRSTAERNNLDRIIACQFATRIVDIIKLWSFVVVKSQS